MPAQEFSWLPDPVQILLPALLLTSSPRDLDTSSAPLSNQRHGSHQNPQYLAKVREDSAPANAAKHLLGNSAAAVK